jgi:hypothetical protein
MDNLKFTMVEELQTLSSLGSCKKLVLSLNTSHVHQGLARNLLKNAMPYFSDGLKATNGISSNLLQEPWRVDFPFFTAILNVLSL